jgi:hypothetical protein
MPRILSTLLSSRACHASNECAKLEVVSETFFKATT